MSIFASDCIAIERIGLPAPGLNDGLPVSSVLMFPLKLTIIGSIVESA